jgi:hypothetical protein
MSRKFSAETADRFRFGLVVYRDPGCRPAVEYVPAT